MGECFFRYWPTRVVPDQRPVNGCVCVFSGYNGNNTMVSNLQKLDAQFSISKHVHASEVADNAQARGQLNVSAELVNQLRQHELCARLHLGHYVLCTHAHTPV